MSVLSKLDFIFFYSYVWFLFYTVLGVLKCIRQVILCLYYLYVPYIDIFLLQLLGKECYDIDIALDDMLGREFCEKINDYLSCTGEEKQGIGVIQWYVILQLCLALML